MDQILELDGQRYSAKYLRETESGRGVLRYAYETGQAFRCICCDDDNALVHVYCRNDVLYLARHRGTGGLHASECDSNKVSDRQLRIKRSQRLLSGIRPVGDRFACNLSLQLSSRLPRTPDVAIPKSDPHRSNTSQGRTSLTGLFLFAWELAGLCLHNPLKPAKGEWQSVGKRLLQHIQRIDLAAGPLSDHVIVPLLHNQSDIERKLEATRKGGKNERRYLLAMGRIARWIVLESGDVKCWLDCFASPLHINRRSWEALASRSWSVHTKTALRSTNDAAHTETAILICRILVDRTGKISMVNGAVVMTTQAWMPVQSSYEREVADALVSAAACFSKPLRQVAGCPFIPDFLVHSQTGDRPYEVAGLLDDPEYAAHLELKLAEYSKYFAESAWVWRVGSEPLPPLV